MKPDVSTQLVLDRMKRHADHGPALFSMSSEDAQRVLAWVGVLNVRAEAGQRLYDEQTAAADRVVQGWPRMKDPTITPAPAVWPPRPWTVKRALGLAEAEGAHQNETDGAAALVLDHSGATWDVQVATDEELAMMRGEAPIPWKTGGFIWDKPSDLDTGFHPRRTHGRFAYYGDQMPKWDGARYAK